MDDADIANDRAELARSAAQTQRKPIGPAPVGMCHYCNGPVPPGRRWCDAECRDGWDKEKPRA